MTELTSTLDDAVRRELASNLVVVAPEAHKALGFVAALGAIRVLTGADGANARALRRLGAEVEVVPGEGHEGTTFSLLDSPDGRDVLMRWAGSRVVTFRPEHRVGRLVASLGSTVLAAPPKVARKLENKESFRALCRSAGLEAVPTETVTWPPNSETLTWLSAWGPRLIVQTARGNAGRRTWLCDLDSGDPADTVPISARLSRRGVLLSPWLDGPTWTVNAVVLGDTVLVGEIMRQINGDERLGARPFGSVGAAFGTAGSERVRERVFGMARAVGELAAQQGFVGFFGIDVVEDSRHGLQLIEMNPRLTATLTAATLAELAVRRVPLTLFHLMACTPDPQRYLDLASRYRESAERPRGGHLIVRRQPGGVPKTVREGLHPLDTYLKDEADPVNPDRIAALWPGQRQVAVWPAGSNEGGPEEDAVRFIVSGELLAADGSGKLSPAVDGLIERWVDAATNAA